MRTSVPRRIARTASASDTRQPRAAEAVSAAADNQARAIASSSDLLTVEDVAAIRRTTVGAIYSKLHRGTFLPLPISERPYRWNRDDIERWKRGEFREAEARLRTKASLRGAYRRREVA